MKYNEKDKHSCVCPGLKAVSIDKISEVEYDIIILRIE